MLSMLTPLLTLKSVPISVTSARRQIVNFPIRDVKDLLRRNPSIKNNRNQMLGLEVQRLNHITVFEHQLAAVTCFLPDSLMRIAGWCQTLFQMR